MKVKYKDVKKFMENYFNDYSQYAQDTETMPKMDKYWTPDVLVTAYIQLKGGEYPLQFQNRRDWQDFLIEGHIKIWETLIPTEMMIDEKQLMTTSMLQIKKYDRVHNKELCDLDGIGYYKLIVNNDNALQIKSLDFFTGDPARLTSLYEI